MTKLDTLYGPCLETERPISKLELKFQPNSLQQLTKDTAASLQKYFESALFLKIPAVIHRKVVILWVMDEPGNIFIAFEELIDGHDGSYLMPYFRESLVTNRLNHEINGGRIGRLGHPSLLAGKRAARIGGEIRFRPEDNDSFHWKINRLSGRYGVRSHQTDAHLAAVHSLFMEMGLHIGTE
ncbi:hypothetical protein [Roseibium sediminicola]|uniref:Uncharacterized protein n=1 Tax=Roseibium sediminicola TaxID=2933272 RepID=A0ABT0H2H8_9HYPH|nr:hypothetical protein [Roseibium sp. CAU 1639]MCK7615283.1 hypothetical protein [Roseibium sp. CAU 1639]